MAGATTAALGLGLGVYQAISSNNQKRDAQKEMNDYERETLDNAFKDMPISLEGVDYMRDENARASANAINAATNSGSRGIIGALPKIVAQSNDVNQYAARYLDDQYNKRNYAIAADNARIEGVTENRDNQNIAALSSQVTAGRQGVWDGLMGIGSSLAYGAKSFSPAENPQVDTFSGQPAGLTTYQQQPIQATPLPRPTATAPNYGPPQIPYPYFDFPNSY